MSFRGSIERHERVRHFGIRLVELDCHSDRARLQSGHDAGPVRCVFDRQGLGKAEASQVCEFVLEPVRHVLFLMGWGATIILAGGATNMMAGGEESKAA
jgi:hypothetical protein